MPARCSCTRYAIVYDPDGNLVELYHPQPVA
jgi:hypothetical protein